MDFRELVGLTKLDWASKKFDLRGKRLICKSFRSVSFQITHEYQY